MHLHQHQLDRETQTTPPHPVGHDKMDSFLSSLLKNILLERLEVARFHNVTVTVVPTFACKGIQNHQVKLQYEKLSNTTLS